jgi:hypothetical protein
MSIKYHADFKPRPDITRNPGVIDVYCTDHRGSIIYLGWLEPAAQYGYEGQYVFLLDADSIMDNEGGHIHIPSNVLRQIAEYGE